MTRLAHLRLGAARLNVTGFAQAGTSGDGEQGRERKDDGPYPFGARRNHLFALSEPALRHKQADPNAVATDPTKPHLPSYQMR